MGYRSDVTVIIYGDKDEVTAFVAGEKLKGFPKGVDHHPLDEEENRSHERNIYDYGKEDEHTMMEFNWWDVKWYDSYPEVDYWSNLESVFNQSFQGTSLCMEVARIGEESTDIVTDYYGQDPGYYLNISRAIEKALP